VAQKWSGSQEVARIWPTREVARRDSAQPSEADLERGPLPIPRPRRLARAQTDPGQVSG
jgi:hypothetical protein